MTPEMQAFVEKSKEAKKQMATEGERVFRAMFKAFFEARPEVLAVRWRQYTPYFNDGDPCAFSVHEVDFKTTEGGTEDDGDYDDGFASTYDMKDAAMKAACKELCRAIGDNEVESIALAAFGDHSMVTVTREKIDVESYDHD